MALQRWIPGADRGDEQAPTEQGKDSSSVIVFTSPSCITVVVQPSFKSKAHRLVSLRRQEFTAYRKERGKMLLSRRNQLLLEFSFWKEPVLLEGPNIYELRSYQLRVGIGYQAVLLMIATEF